MLRRLEEYTHYQQQLAAAGHCLSDTDGDCDWDECPQRKEYKSTCPRYEATHRDEDEE